MSSFSRRAILVLPVAVAACGFAPAYAPGGDAASLIGKIWVEDPTEKRGFDLVQRFEERLGRPQNARYLLAYVITAETIGLGITPEDVITRNSVKGAVDWTLSDKETGARLTGGRVQSFTSYTATGSTVAGQAAAQDAETRLMRILADQIVTRLIAVAGQIE
jgi:LPS-assembly lipoprotein